MGRATGGSRGRGCSSVKRFDFMQVVHNQDCVRGGCHTIPTSSFRHVKHGAYSGHRSFLPGAPFLSLFRNSAHARHHIRHELPYRSTTSMFGFRPQNAHVENFLLAHRFSRLNQLIFSAAETMLTVSSHSEYGDTQYAYCRMYQGPGAADRFSSAKAVVRPSVIAFQ